MDLAQTREIFRALVGEPINPEAIAEVGDLNDRRALVERRHSEAMDDVLIGMRDVPLFGRRVIRDHGQVIERRNAHAAVAAQNRLLVPFDLGMGSTPPDRAKMNSTRV
jgi:hypothetical protein